MKEIVQRLSPPVKTLIYWGTWHKAWNVQIKYNKVWVFFHILASVNMIEIIHCSREGRESKTPTAGCGSTSARRVQKGWGARYKTITWPLLQQHPWREPLCGQWANPSCDPHSTCICSVGSRGKCARGKEIWDEASNVYLAAREHFSTP